MPGLKANLIIELTAMFNDLSEKTAAEKADTMATAIDNYIGTVTVAIGTVVKTPDTINGTTTTPGVLQ